MRVPENSRYQKLSSPGPRHFIAKCSSISLGVSMRIIEYHEPPAAYARIKTSRPGCAVLGAERISFPLQHRQHPKTEPTYRHVIYFLLISMPIPLPGPNASSPLRRDTRKLHSDLPPFSGERRPLKFNPAGFDEAENGERSSLPERRLGK